MKIELSRRQIRRAVTKMARKREELLRAMATMETERERRTAVLTAQAYFSIIRKVEGGDALSGIELRKCARILGMRVPRRRLPPSTPQVLPAVEAPEQVSL